MATAPIPTREPEQFVAGDTLLLHRNLPDYLPSDGWVYRLTVTQPLPNGSQVVATTDSTADGDSHSFSVDNWLSELQDGVYILTGSVIKAANGDRHQVYHNDAFLVTTSDAANAAAGPVKTDAQQMLEIILDTLKELYKRKYTETDVQRNKFVLQKSSEALADYKFWFAKRQQEIQQQNVRNGRASGAVQEPIFKFF